MRVYCDFDGTIATRDVTDLVLRKLAPPEWEIIERQWTDGVIDAATCMRRQIALLSDDMSAVDAVLEGVELDPGFVRFVEWCRVTGIEIVVVSDGVDYFIRNVLDRYGFGDLTILSNQLDAGRDGLSLKQPLSRPECGSGHGVCKCAVVGASLEPVIYVGDGKSDECVSGQADCLFAKSKLALFCEDRGIPFSRYESFADVERGLSARMKVDSRTREISIIENILAS